MSKGHGYIKIEGKGVIVSRFVYTRIKGKIPNTCVVAHTCDNGLCVNPDHLEAITEGQNIRDAFARHRYKRGFKKFTKHHGAKP